MNFRFTAISAVSVAAIAFQFSLQAQNSRPLTNQIDKVSYAIGLNIASGVKQRGFEIDADVVALAIKDSLAGRELKVSEQDANQAMMAYQQELRAKREAERLKMAEKNRKDGDTFLAANKSKPGIKTHEVKLNDGNTAEFQYKIITEGKGEVPGAGDTAVLNLKGTTADGKEFESTEKRGQPTRTPINRFPLHGVREALQMMPAGSKWELYLPSTLAFGDFGSGTAVEPGAAVIYEVELVSTETPQPLTSDIIKVPSAEELKKGAQIEVIKAEDLKKAQTNSAAPRK
jgi:FKBP-type peptidyl-prolyl cis-trans isomerase